MPAARPASLLRLLHSVVCATLVLCGGSGAQGADTFYQGKTVFIYIGFAPGRQLRLFR